ncbi:MAG: tyrosine-type recombinase/integrase [Propionicimonas sp.]
MSEVTDWLRACAYSPGSSAITMGCLQRFSAWLASEGLGLADLSDGVIDRYLVEERIRLDGGIPAAVQHLAVFRRFLVARGTLAPRPPASRDRGGLPRLLVGPLVDLLPDLVCWLKCEGYARGTALSVAGTAARLSVWMQQAAVDVAAVDDVVLARFVAVQQHAPDYHPSSAKRIVTIRKFLLARGHLKINPLHPVPATVVDVELSAWASWQQVERGVGAGTIADRRSWAHDLVTALAAGNCIVDWSGLDCSIVNRYVAERGRGYSLSSRRHLVDAMRSLARWAFLTGRLSRSVSAGILRPRASRATLPKALNPAQVAALTATADPATLHGARDRAVIVLIARLGLRAGEVASLTLDDIDWAAARLSVTGKGGRRLDLPLPVDVGSTLVDYLRVRARGAHGRNVFIRLRPPLCGLGRQGISGIIKHRAAQAGLGVVHAHRLRHTVATSVLAAGGTLIEARELLGHARIDTTMIYAKTDLASLRTLTVPFGQVPR